MPVNLAVSTIVPPGAVLAFARLTPPLGWLKANGDVVPNGTGTVQGVNANFTDLYAAVGTSFGAAGKLPNLNGIFIRGTDTQTITVGTTALTYTGTFAEVQQDSFRAHSHKWGYVTSQVPGGANFLNQASSNLQRDTSIEGGPETRPANIALLYCIKY